MRSGLILILILTSLGCCSQELSCRQFTVKDGLPGAIVYQSLQDRNGFMWFATNQGVSRFDGRTFKNFSKEDGLPDNEIVKLYLDKHNDVWFISLLGIPSVFYHDSIRRFDSCMGVRSVCEDGLTDDIVLVSCHLGKRQYGYYHSANKAGSWAFVFRACNIYDHPDHRVLRASSPGKINASFVTVNDTIQTLILQYPYTEKHFDIRIDIDRSWLPFGWPQHCCISSDQKGAFLISMDSLYYADVHRLRALISLKELGIDEKKNNDINSLFSENDSTLWISSRSKGLLHLRHPLGPDRVVRQYFKDLFCTSITKDRESGYWVTTHSDGVYYMPNLSFYSVSAYSDLAIKSVLCLQSLDDQSLVAGFSDGNILVIGKRQPVRRLNSRWAFQNKNNRVMDVGRWGQYMLAGTDGGLYRIFKNGERKLLLQFWSIKEFYTPSDTTVIVATTHGIFVDDVNGRIKRSILLTRATCVAGLNERHFYWGSQQGMFRLKGDSNVNMGEKFPPLAGVINHIDIAPDSAIWVSTGQGIVILKHDRLQQLTKEQGLPSNLCKHVAFSEGICWVSTDKGIARIKYRWDKDRLVYTLSNITEEDGLTSNDVNQTVAVGPYIWAATARGISYFAKTYVSYSAWQPLINITRIVAGDSALALRDSISLGPERTRLLVELSGISFRSGKAISYDYRLQGLDSNWRRIVNNSIEFSALPFGAYTLEVSAIDRWGKRSSHPRTIFIRHDPPFWLTTWFILSSYLVMALAAGAGVYIFHRKRRQKKEEDYHLKKKMQDLEMMALRAQMNPHFIFNCLTSIQYHIMNADIKNASAYLHKFSTLIRQTLQNSTASMILLRDEIRLLQLYLDLEKLRLGDRMDYHIDLSPELDPDQQAIPPMIVQPYVENAVKHGISPLEGVRGSLLIGFNKSDGCICCTIEDNGPGMDVSGAYASGETSHRSMGKSITEKRIHTLNELQKEKIHILIKDKRTSGYPASGTIIQLYFPITSI